MGRKRIVWRLIRFDSVHFSLVDVTVAAAATTAAVAAVIVFGVACTRKMCSTMY